jgi:ribosomal protein S18 acetylase RimI-like enzyme
MQSSIESLAPAELVVKSAEQESVADDEIEDLLVRTYVNGGFTDMQRGALIFAPSAVRVRGEILHVRNVRRQLVGMVVFVSPDSPGRVFAEVRECELHLLATAPEARRCGIGRALIMAAAEKARREGFERILLWTQPSMVAAQRLYRTLGFARVPNRDFVLARREFLFFQKNLR